ncbi:MAG: S24/S26 family peptidase [Prevotella sp.]|nr:S24/S26 family peptidase [Prevotella sp.]MDD7274033.1 S24/S26 family peptidase [Prevotellaceae bacterium]MDY3935624.1 S24/S26 family peptidase [Prevotella sp.]MDY4217977.1 S24/S26 family peptidase [Prevotella sp.]
MKAIQTKQFANAILLPEVVKFLNEGKTVTLRLKGYSMRPFLENNRDKALLVKPSKIAVGDPVLAEISPKHYVLHRIIKIEGNDVTLMGDGNLGVEYCKKENIVGAVIGFYRKDRKNLDSTDGWKWKLYSKVWMTLRPLRRYLLAFYRKLWMPIFGAI